MGSQLRRINFETHCAESRPGEIARRFRYSFECFSFGLRASNTTSVFAHFLGSQSLCQKRESVVSF